MSSGERQISATTTCTGIGLVFGCATFMLCVYRGVGPGNCVVRAVLCGFVSATLLSLLFALIRRADIPGKK